MNDSNDALRKGRFVFVPEGVASVDLTAQYALCTFAGVTLAALILHLVGNPPAVLATLVAASARVGVALNPSLGFMALTMFMLFVVHVTMVSNGVELAGTLAATYPRLPVKDA
ncbi:MAG: hypothetical protein ABI537_03795 [Casimicrobiaceae bacterium]